MRSPNRGIRHIDMPLTPFRVWQALHAADGAGADIPSDDAGGFRPGAPARANGGWSRRSAPRISSVIIT